MLHGLFITGTDTSVGKTIVAAALMHRYRHLGGLRYWKPIQTGIEQDNDTEVVRRLGACRESELFTDGVRLPRPVSPHLAAQLSQTHIHISTLTTLVASQPDGRWFVEGAGGVLVPLNVSELMVDLMVQLAMPVVVVARAALGIINHTLLTLEALRNRSLHVAGVVVVGERNAANCQAIEQYGAVGILGEMPFLPVLTPGSLGEWAGAGLDSAGQLSKYLA